MSTVALLPQGARHLHQPAELLPHLAMHLRHRDRLLAHTGQPPCRILESPRELKPPLQERRRLAPLGVARSELFSELLQIAPVLYELERDGLCTLGDRDARCVGLRLRRAGASQPPPALGMGWGGGARAVVKAVRGGLRGHGPYVVPTAPMFVDCTNVGTPLGYPLYPHWSMVTALRLALTSVSSSMA